MNNELKLEYYLSQLDRALWALPVGQRSEIVTEIKSHIREAMDRDSTKTIDAVLADMGSAQDVANKYLSDRGIATVSTGNRTGSWFKYLAYGFLGFFGLIFLGVGLLIWHFTPLIKFDAKSSRMELLGGTIDIKNTDGKFKIGNVDINDFDRKGGKDNYSRGTAQLKVGTIRQIKIPFNTAKINIVSSDDSTFSWDCESSSPATTQPVIAAGVATLNLEVLKFANCELEIPKGIELAMNGVNGKVSIEEPQSAMTLDLVNGKVAITPDDDKEYNFDVNVKNGMADTFKKSQNPKAIKMKVSVVNGLINNEGDRGDSETQND
jgi:hypothetical protein